MAATRIPYMRMILSGRYPQKTKALHQQYGDVVRIAPDELSFTNGEAWKPIYGTRTGHSQKPKDYRFYAPTFGGNPSIIVSNDADHSRFRRLLSHAFSDSSLRGQEPIIKNYVDLLMQRLHENILDGKNAVDMVAWYNFTTFDIIGDLAFGESFDCLKNSEYHPWISILFSSLKYAAYTNVARRLPGSKYLVPLITPKKIVSRRNTHLALTEEKVKGRITKSNERPDFFGNILKHNNTEKGFSFPELITNGSTLIIAGSETTATLLSGVTYLLLRNPLVLAKLQDEIRSAFTKEEEITLESCNKLEYCLAVLTETLRMYPPVAVGLPRIVDAQGDMIAGNWVPGGVSTGFASQRVEELYLHFHFRLSFPSHSFLPAIPQPISRILRNLSQNAIWMILALLMTAKLQCSRSASALETALDESKFNVIFQPSYIHSKI
jgi:cytochrome P450